MQTIKHAIISAAGLGSRLQLNMPKCLIEFDGVSLLERQIALLDDVEDVRVVVGFMEEKVINVAKRHRKDILFVRNPLYTSTTNCYSISLGINGIRDPFMLIDGDLLIDPISFAKFMNSYEVGDELIGYTDARSDDAVYVKKSASEQLLGFSRDEVTQYEWPGIACLSNVAVNRDDRFLFEVIARIEDVKTHYIDCIEIDTPDDLSRAHSIYQNKYKR